MLPWERNIKFRERADILELLELAQDYSENEHGNTVYTFHTPFASAVLCIDYGVEVRVNVTIPNQVEPVAMAHLEDCELIRTVHDSRDKYIEFTGQLIGHQVGPHYRAMKSGFRLTLAPSMSVRMFFVAVEL